MAIHNPRTAKFHTPAPAVVPAAAPLPMCSICMEVMQSTSNPFEASCVAASSNMIPFGMFIGPRQDKHVACLDCLGYVMNKLDDKLKPAFPHSQSRGAPAPKCIERALANAPIPSSVPLRVHRRHGCLYPRPSDPPRLGSSHLFGSSSSEVRGDIG